MKLAVNYSHATQILCQQGVLQVDVYKCPAWPHIVQEAQPHGRVYVHFPLQIGRGTRGVLNGETKQAPDWAALEALLRHTDTPYINLHPVLLQDDYAHIPLTSTAESHLDEAVDNLLRDVTAVCQRFGPERVIVENIPSEWGRYLRLLALPQLYHTLINETGCGFLLDLSHAWLVATRLRQDPRAYVSALPVTHLREMHTTGIQRLTGRWLELAQAHFPADFIKHQPLDGQLIDHLPYRDEDWPFVAWAMQEIHAGRWSRPWAVALEFGGVGGFWEEVADPETLRQQVPRLYELVKSPQIQKSS